MLHVPTVRCNLLSVSTLADFGFSFPVDKNGVSIYFDGMLYGHGHFYNSLFMMDLECMFESHNYLVNIASSSNDVASEAVK